MLHDHKGSSRKQLPAVFPCCSDLERLMNKEIPQKITGKKEVIRALHLDSPTEEGFKITTSPHENQKAHRLPFPLDKVSHGMQLY